MKSHLSGGISNSQSLFSGPGETGVLGSGFGAKPAVAFVQIHNCLEIVAERGQMIISVAADVVIAFDIAGAALFPQAHWLEPGRFGGLDEPGLIFDIDGVQGKDSGSLFQKFFVDGHRIIF